MKYFNIEDHKIYENDKSISGRLYKRANSIIKFSNLTERAQNDILHELLLEIQTDLKLLKEGLCNEK
jgi:hypothetical protein